MNSEERKRLYRLYKLGWWKSKEEFEKEIEHLK